MLQNRFVASDIPKPTYYVIELTIYELFYLGKQTTHALQWQKRKSIQNRTLLPLHGENDLTRLTRGDADALPRAGFFWAFSLNAQNLYRWVSSNNFLLNRYCSHINVNKP